MVPAGLALRPPRGQWSADGAERDVRGFGALLYQMLTGTPVPADANRGMFRSAGPRTGVMGTRAAAVRLAGKCLGLLDVKLTMQQVSTEARVLWLLARQTGMAEDLPKQLPPATASPFLVAAPDDASEADEAEAPERLPSSPSLEPVDSHCPTCGSATVYFSRARSAVERMLEKMGTRICRCHRCYHRYLEIGSLQIAKDMPMEPVRRKRPKRRK